MEIIALSIGFLFLILITGTALSVLSYVVFKDKAMFNMNIQTMNAQLSSAYNEFQAGIEANRKLADDINRLLDETQPSLQAVQNFDDRVRVIENTLRLKAVGSPRTGVRVN